MPKHDVRTEKNIDFRRLSMLAETGIMRALILGGYGHAASKIEDLKEYQLQNTDDELIQGAMVFKFFDKKFSNAEVAKHKVEFSKWVIACAFKEILEHFANMLNYIHRYGILVLADTDGYGFKKSSEKIHSTFVKTPSAGKKLKLLEDGFGISSAYRSHIETLHNARNIVTHGLGYVTEDRYNEDGTVTVKWVRIQMYILDMKTGDKIRFEDAIGLVLQKGGHIVLEIENNSINLSAGEKLEISPMELQEICYFFKAMCVPDILRSFKNFLEQRGVPIHAE